MTDTSGLRRTSRSVTPLNHSDRRARATIRKITELFADDTNARVELTPNVQVELILDPLDHQRLDDPDSEIIDRLTAAKGYINHRIDFLSR